MDELDKMSRMVKWYIAIAAILVAAFVWCTGCERRPSENAICVGGIGLEIATLKGHDYVVVGGGYGVGVIHAESCKCKEHAKEKK